MAAKSELRVKHFNTKISLAVSSSESSVETEKSDQKYTDDFHSSVQSSFEETSDKLSEISSDYSVNTSADDDDRLSKFFDEKLQALNENQVRRIGKSQDGLQRRENHEELDPFWLKKLENLRQRNTGNCCENTMDKLNSNRNDKCTNKPDEFELDTNVNEIGCFQSAYERLKFNNLREKCRNLLSSEIHSLETCKKCQEMQEKLRKDEFCTNCMRKVKQNIVQEKFVEHIQSRSSAMLIANIIEDGPKPSWDADEIWAKLLAGGHQHVKCINQN